MCLITKFNLLNRRVIPPINKQLNARGTDDVSCGKSMVLLTCVLIDGGATVVIENILSLGADQLGKVNNTANDNVKFVKSYKLDIAKSKEEEKVLCVSIISHLTANIDSSIILHSLPILILKNVWFRPITQLIENEMPQLFCVDKVHLFLMLVFPFEFNYSKSKVRSSNL